MYRRSEWNFLFEDTPGIEKCSLMSKKILMTHTGLQKILLHVVWAYLDLSSEHTEQIGNFVNNGR